MAIKKGGKYVAKGTPMNWHLDGKTVTALEDGPGKIKVRCSCCDDVFNFWCEDLR